MKRVLFLALGLAPIAAWAAASADVALTADLTAAQIVEKNVAAHGGLQAWRAVSTLTMSGKLEAGGKKNAELPFVLKMKRSHMSRLEIRFQDQTAVQIYDGAHGWKVRPFLGRDEVEPFTATEEKAAADWQELDGPLMDYQAKGITVELEGMEPVEAHKAYKLKLTLKDGDARHVWIDAANFLELKIEGEPRTLDGKPHNVAIYYRDYKTDHGLTVPHVMESVVEGARQSHKMNIEQVAFNQPMEDALFAKPVLAPAKSPDQQGK